MNLGFTSTEEIILFSVGNWQTQNSLLARGHRKPTGSTNTMASSCHCFLPTMSLGFKVNLHGFKSFCVWSRELQQSVFEVRSRNKATWLARTATTFQIIIAVIELTTSLCFEVLVPWIILKGTYYLKLLMKGFSSLISQLMPSSFADGISDTKETRTFKSVLHFATLDVGC